MHRNRPGNGGFSRNIRISLGNRQPDDGSVAEDVTESRARAGSDLRAEAWAGEPEQTDGVAVMGMGMGDIRLARVPQCPCGDLVLWVGLRTAGDENC